MTDPSAQNDRPPVVQRLVLRQLGLAAPQAPQPPQPQSQPVQPVQQATGFNFMPTPSPQPTQPQVIPRRVPGLTQKNHGAPQAPLDPSEQQISDRAWTEQEDEID